MLRHRDIRRRLQRDHATAITPGLAFDVDTTDDLAELQARDGYWPVIKIDYAR